MLLGFTTGKITTISLFEKVNLFRKLGCNAIELSILDINRFENFKEILPALDLLSFSFRSVHAPCFRLDGDKKTKIFYKDDEQTRNILDKVSWLTENAKADLVVFHPDLVEDWSVFKEFNFPLAVENMDWTKNKYKSVEDIKKLFETVDASMVLDINHCFTNDQTNKLAKEMLFAFNERIKEIHLSGFNRYHEPLYQTKQETIINLITRRDVPVILEGFCQTVDEYEKEFQYITEKIGKI